MAQKIQIKKSEILQKIMSGSSKKELAKEYGVTVSEMNKTVKALGIERMPVFRGPVVELVDDTPNTISPSPDLFTQSGTEEAAH